MSWSGTVRCGHCYAEGHNKRTCPTLREEIKDNPDGWRARNEKHKKSSYKVRACTYCQPPGHNRRTCETHLEDFSFVLKVNKHFYQRMCDHFASQGIGTGSLLKRSQWGDEDIFMCKGFNYRGFVATCNWSRWGADDAVYAAMLNKPDRVHSFPPPHSEALAEFSECHSASISVVAPISQEKAAAQFKAERVEALSQLARATQEYLKGARDNYTMRQYSEYSANFQV